jgi:cytochrome c oxidase cbb3-type subunit 3
MSADSDRDLLREHEYDGIQEYDNPTPGWWNLIFLGTFLFALWYILYHHASTISTSVAQGYETDVSDDLKKRFSAIGDLKPDEPTLLKFMANEEWKLVGAPGVQGPVRVLPRSNAAGQIGPNLTDDYYKNVQQLTDIPKVIAAVPLRAPCRPGRRGCIPTRSCWWPPTWPPCAARICLDRADKRAS